MRLRTILTLPFMLGVIGFTFTAAPVPVEPPAVSELAQAKLKAAQASYEDLLAQEKKGQFDPETRYIWSKRILDTQREIGRNKADHLQALQEHRDRIVAVEKYVKTLYRAPRTPGEKTGDFFTSQLQAVNFYRSEAELWLEQAKKK